MHSAFIQSRIDEIRDALAASGEPGGVPSETDKLLGAIERGAFCFRAEAWHSVAPNGDTGRTVSEMLLHIPAAQDRPASMFDAMHRIYGRGQHRQMDALIVACALQQAEALAQFPISINISVRSAGCRAFWKDVAPLLSRFPKKDVIFEILESHYVPTRDELRTMKAVRRLGHRFALDDVNFSLRDILRLESLGEIADYVKVCGTMIQNWELGHAGLVSFVDDVRRKLPKARLVAEWVTSVANARSLSEIGFHAVQGRSLPATNDRFAALFRQSYVPPFRSQSALCERFSVR